MHLSPDDYKYLFQHSSIPMWAFNVDDKRIVMVNNAAIKMYGYTQEEFLTMTIWDLRPEEEVHRLKEYIKETLEEDIRLSGPWKHQKKDGSIIDVQITSHVIKNENVTIRIVAITDITEQLNSVELLRKQEAQLRLAIVAGRMVTLDIDYNNNELRFSDNAEEFMGLRNTAITFTEAFSIIHPADLGKVQLALKKGKEEGILNDLQFRILNPDKGKVSWVDRRSVVNFGPDDKPIGSRGILVDITELKEAEEKLQLSEQRFKALVQEGSDLIGILDKEGKYQYVSPTSTNILGLEPAFLKGKNAFDLIHPDDVERVKEQFGHILSEKQIHIKPFRFIDGHGNFRWIETIATNLFDDPAINGIVVNSRDITERQKIEEHLQLLESVVKHAHDAVIITEAEPIDGQGPVIIYVNKAFTEMTGYAPHEVIGKTPRILQGLNTDSQVLQQLKNSLQRWEAIEVELINYKKNGESYWVNFSVFPIANDKGWYTHWISIQRQITERKKSEEMTRRILDTMVEERTKELKASLEKEKEVAELKNRFVSMVSHEFRTPLASINFAAGYLKRFKNKLTEESKDEKIEQIITQVNHMTQIMEDILTIGKSDAKIQSNITPLSLHKFVNTLIKEVMEPMDNSHQIKVEIKVTEDIFVTDEKLFRSILVNLLSNAIKFSPKKKLVMLKLYDDSAKLTFEVTDFGVGIHLIDQAKIFEPFHRTTEASTIQGAGLGLSIVKRAVDTLHGTIWLKSKVGIGSTFTVTLPKNAG
jgi:PAS domain S-box-containing protein